MKIEMNLTEKFFLLLEQNLKDIEVRLLDEKRANLNIGDIILFKHGSKSIPTIILQLKRYNNFYDLINDIAPTRIGLSSSKKDAINELCSFYPLEKQKKYKALAIKIKKISN